MFAGLVQLVEQLVYKLVVIEFSLGLLGSDGGFLVQGPGVGWVLV